MHHVMRASTLFPPIPAIPSNQLDIIETDLIEKIRTYLIIFMHWKTGMNTRSTVAFLCIYKQWYFYQQHSHLHHFYQKII